MTVDVVGIPLHAAKLRLQEAGMPYKVEVTRPTRDYFKIDESCPYVVRECVCADGTVCLTVAYKQVRQEAS